MDGLTFTSTAIENLVWPLLIVGGYRAFKEPLQKMMQSVKRMRWRDFEVECELPVPQETRAEEIDPIVMYLRRSPHSFQWFRDSTEFQYSNEQFEELIHKHAERLEKVNTVSRDKSENEPLPGMRLKRAYRQKLDQALVTD
jgi:hypothetical protein